MKKELLKEWGESTAYSAKSHFKTADLKRIWVTSLIMINVVFAVFSILELGLPLLSKVLGMLSIIASILILVFESQNEKNSVSRHMMVGDKYLEIHYDLQKIFHSEQFDDKEYERVVKKVKGITKMNKPIINQIAKKWARHSIENKLEMKNWWK